ncbi:hypothetical protein O9929_11555 [Vibrio lentus]|nr:hypothetical protein [Vibrio lentus]
MLASARSRTSTNLRFIGASSSGKDGAAVFMVLGMCSIMRFATEQVSFPYGGWYLALSGNEHVLMDEAGKVMGIHGVRLVADLFHHLVLALHFYYFIVCTALQIAVLCMMS